MNRTLRTRVALLAAGLLVHGVALTLELPATCDQRTTAHDANTPIPELRERIAALAESDPYTSIDLLCSNLPRVEREYGEQSLEMARWTQALATPLIAYVNAFDEAERLLSHARPILERRLGPKSPEVAELHVATAWMSFRRGLNDEAAAAWVRALGIRELHPGPGEIELQKVLAGLSQVRAAQRRFGDARALAQRGLDSVRANGDPVSDATAAFQNAMANIAIREENFTEARSWAEAQVATELALRERRGPDQPVTAYAMLGRVLLRLDEFDAAERAMREAVRLATAVDGPLQRGTYAALVGLATLLNERGRPDEALGFAASAVERGAREYGADVPILVPALQQRSDAHRALGQLAAALEDSDRAASIEAAHGSAMELPARARLLRSRGMLLAELGDGESAARALSGAVTLAGEDKTLATERASTLVALASVQADIEPQRAETDLREALRLYRERIPDDHPAILRALDELCALEIRQRRTPAPACDEAVARLARARHADPPLRRSVLQRQAELAARRDDLAGMQRHALESLSVASTLGTPDALWRADFLLARTLWLQGEPDLAVLFGKRALDSIQALRRSLVGAAARLEPRFVERRTDVYRTVADWLMAAGRYDEALEVLALLKFAEREEFLVRAEQPAAAPGPLSRTERERTLEERIAGVIGEETDAQLDVLSQLRLADRITPTERARLERMIDAGRAAEAARLVALESFIAEARAEAPAAANRSRIVEAGRLDRELRRFGDEAVLAIYLLTEDRLRILVATRERSIEHDVRIPAAELRREIGLFLDDLAARRDVEARARQLHEWLLRPVDQAAREAGARRLILWPDGALRYVPFAALHDGRSHAVDRYDIQLFAETSVTSTAVPGRREAFAVRGLGVTHAVGGYAALPAVADELCSIVRGPIAGLETPGARCRRAATGEPLTGAGALRGEGYADERFTREQLESLLAASGDFGVLHMGTHFSLRPGNALRSFLLLGDGTRYTLDRLAALDLSGIRLMTLSACQTALGGAVTDDGREVEGLSALVQQRGVDRVVASLWRVEDRSTALLMQRFYDRLSGPRAGGAHALRRAQLDVRRHVESGKRPYEHPFYWAGFTLSAASF